MSYLDHIKACNNFDASAFRPFEIADVRAGWVRQDNVAHLAAFPEVFVISQAAVALAPGLDDFDSARRQSPGSYRRCSAGVLPRRGMNSIQSHWTATIRR